MNLLQWLHLQRFVMLWRRGIVRVVKLLSVQLVRWRHAIVALFICAGYTYCCTVFAVARAAPSSWPSTAQVAETAVQFFITNDKPNVAGLVLAGSADFKNELQNSDMFDQRLNSIVVAVVDTSYG